MAFVSARFVELIEPDGSITTDRHIKAIDDRGHEWQMSIDCQEGDWLRYLEAGGVIDPYEEKSHDESQHTDLGAGDAAASGGADDTGST